MVNDRKMPGHGAQTGSRSENSSVTGPIRKPNTKHARMPVSQRAKQFMPFSAVVGLDAALREKEREKEFEAENDYV